MNWPYPPIIKLGFSLVRVRLLCPPARRLLRSGDKGIPAVLWSADRMQIPGGICELTTARVTTTPLSLNISTQSLSMIPSDGVLYVHPQRINPTRQSRHSLVVTIRRMDMPFPMWREIVEHDRGTDRCSVFGELQVGVLRG